MSDKKELEDLQKVFKDASTLSECLSVARKAGPLHTRFQHYTKFANLVAMLENHEFWLTRGDSTRLDDQLEWQKYGRKAEWKRTFVGCFSHVTGENAMMWGLYGPKNIHSVQLTIPRDEMFEWIEWLRSPENNRAVLKSAGKPSRDVASVTGFDVSFGDLVYLAVDDGKRYDRKRKNTAAWFDTKSESPIPGLTAELHRTDITGWVKDYEWKDERESRIVVKTASGKASSAKSLAIPICPSVLSKMSVTFSPWATKKEIGEMENALMSILRKEGLAKTKAHRFKESFLSGALQKWEDK